MTVDLLMPSGGKTILAIGAHYDDCPFGISGILLRAVRQQYRVVILNIIGDYTEWAPVRGRADQLIELSTRLAHERGIEIRFLPYASMRFEPNAATARDLAKVVADVRPDVAFMLWHQDHHPDHEVAAVLSKIALRQPGMLLGRDDVAPVERIYAYDNGPRHTIGFEPDTFIDISTEWPAAIEWLGRLMAFVQNRPYDPEKPDGAQRAKEILARYRGLTAGVDYAEALHAIGEYPTDLA